MTRTKTIIQRYSETVKLVEAAGGVVCRLNGDSQIEVLLVGGTNKDPGYWGFPKGKCKPGEAIELTAIREIEEETGLRVELLALVGISEYDYISYKKRKRRHKSIRFFLAYPFSGKLTSKNGGYKQVIWVPIDEAYRILTYAADQEILRQAQGVLEGTTLYWILILRARDNC
jgi:8-oxo-dGTP pyrophosphatase MutT (NUDIX family)